MGAKVTLSDYFIFNYNRAKQSDNSLKSIKMKGLGVISNFKFANLNGWDTENKNHITDKNKHRNQIFAPSQHFGSN